MKEVLKCARVTLTELLLLEAVILSQSNREKAIDEINMHVSNMGALPESERLKPSDLNKHLWSFCDRVIRGVPL